MIDAIVFDPVEPWLATRTLRALSRHGVDAVVAGPGELASQLASATRPVWLLRAGAWPFSPPAPVLAHAAGRSVVALGATAECDAWQSVLARTGGDLRGVGQDAWPRVDSAIAFDPRAFAGSVAAAGTVEGAARAAARVVRAPSLDVGFHRALRVVLAVTTLHRGGAERVVLDLAAELRALGHDVTLAVLDRPARATFEEPAGTIHLTDFARSRAERLDGLARIALERGADAIHVHLFDGDDVHRLCEGDVPVVVTVHNSEPGWPYRLRRVLDASSRPLLLGCAMEVTRQLAAAGMGARTRTAWNGIAPARPPADRARARAALGVPGDAPVLAAIANHRPQKRLERLPAILAALGGDARLLLVGEPVSAEPAALAIEARVREEAARWGVAERVVFAGSRFEMEEVYAAADVILSVSAFEGLSLVHLEAAAAGVPLVTTRVSGTEELAAKHARLGLVAVDAPEELAGDGVVGPRRDSLRDSLGDELARGVVGSRRNSLRDSLGDELAGDGVGPRRDSLRDGLAGAVAREVARALGTSRANRAELAPDFTARAMAARHVDLYARAAVRRASRGGVVLITNNFSTGGAQTSGRRLLVELARQGVRVRAVVLEEQAAYPTPGRAALERAGVVVDVAPRVGSVDALVTARAAVAIVDEAGPDAVLFWNAIPEVKILIADLLLDVPVFDVSPGEMYFASFERYFRRPRTGSPYLSLRDYGRLLAGAIVKYGDARARTESSICAPVSVVRNGVEVPSRPRRRAGPAPGCRPVVGTLARLAPDKRLEQLVDSVRAREFELVIAGAPERGSEDYARALREGASGLPIAFAGERDPAEFLGEIDVFAMISEPGGCPNALLEAMAAGLPIVATDHGGAREVVGDAGVIVPRADASALADEVHALLADPPRRAALGARAHARAAEHFSVERMATEYRRLCSLRAM